MENLQTAPLRAGYFRWVICGLLLLGTTKNYMDRWVLSALKTTLQHSLGWSEINYSNLVAAFQLAYALGMLAAGRLIDRYGTRLGYALVMVFWSLASMAHAAASSFSGFLMARVALGLGESARHPLQTSRSSKHLCPVPPPAQEQLRVENCLADDVLRRRITEGSRYSRYPSVAWWPHERPLSPPVSRGALSERLFRAFPGPSVRGRPWTAVPTGDNATGADAAIQY